jgi:hypothetical protein
MTAGSSQKVRIAVSCLIEVWDAKTHNWLPESYKLPASMEKLAEAVFTAKKICLKVTIDGKVRYIMTDQSAINELSYGGKDE